jgi:rhodanese-related sulfurtransferase
MGGGGMSPNPDFMTVMTAKFDKDAPLVVGCKMGGRSARACEMLDAAGFTQLKNIDGGFSGRGDARDPSVRGGWSGSGLPVTTTPAPGATWTELRGKR